MRWLVWMGVAACAEGPVALEIAHQPLAIPTPRAHLYAPERPNIVVVVLDDVGIGRLDLYGGPMGVATPNLDQLASEGVRFERVWAHPTCSPTRAALLTGRQPSRYGLHTHIDERTSFQMPLEEVTLAEALAPYGYTAAAVGKWHLAGNKSPSSFFHPLDQGFAHHSGSSNNLEPAGTGPRYFDYWKTIDGRRVRSKVYATTDTTNDAIAMAQGLPEPWLLWVAYNAAHSPAHRPPASLLPKPLSAQPPDHELYVAGLQALDTELGRLFQAFDDETWVVVIGDNAVGRWGLTPGVPGFEDDRLKRSVYEGGVRVPLLVRGPDVPADTVADAIVADVDLFPTVLEMAGVPRWAAAWANIDGVSFFDAVLDPDDPGDRRHVIQEHIEPNGAFGAYSEWFGMVTDGRYKLVAGLDQPYELYDLDAGWPEGEDLMLNPTEEHRRIRTKLARAWWEQRWGW